MKQAIRLTVSCVLLVAAFLSLQVRGTGEAVPLRRSLDSFPRTLGAWEARDRSVLEAGVRDILKAEDYLLQRYADRGGRSVWLFVGYWGSQRKGAQPHSPKLCLPGAGWEPLEGSRLFIPLAGSPSPLAVNRLVIQKERVRQVVLYWYLAQGTPVAGEVDARVTMVRNAVLHNRTDGALVRITSPVYGTVEETTDYLVRYVQAMHPALGGHLPG